MKEVMKKLAVGDLKELKAEVCSEEMKKYFVDKVNKDVDIPLLSEKHEEKIFTKLADYVEAAVSHGFDLVIDKIEKA